MKLKDRFGFFAKTERRSRPFESYIRFKKWKYITGHDGFEVWIGRKRFHFIYKF